MTLAEVPLLAGADADALEALAADGKPIRVLAGDWLLREGDAAEDLFVVVRGRLRVVTTTGEGEQRTLRILGPGAAIGELAILTGGRRSASVQAVRDSELRAIDTERFLDLLGRDPELSIGLARALARQLQQSGGIVEPDAPPAVFTVASQAGVDIRPFWEELSAGFAERGPTATFADDGQGGDRGRDLADLEAQHAHVLLLAELDGGEWASFCLRQADRVLLVADGAPPQELAAPEGCDIAFLGTPSVQDISAWRAAARPRAHHIVDPAELPESTHRIARRLVGGSLGLVLSGGGARAFAHLGVLQVLDEEGLVIDRVGGTSMGAFVAAMVALGWSPETMLEVCRTEVRRSPFSDYTVPRHALIRARRADSMFRRLFGDVTLEELPRSLFTVSADLLSGEMVVHRDGPLVQAVSASMAIPGLAPPVSYGTHLLIDGGVLNNLPIDLMVADEPGPVVAVDVMRRIDIDELKASARTSLPTILETLSRATVLGSVDRARANRGLAQIVITPEVQDVPLRDFHHLDRAVDAGRRAAEEALAAGAKDALLAALSPTQPARGAAAVAH